MSDLFLPRVIRVSRESVIECGTIDFLSMAAACDWGGPMEVKAVRL